MKQYNFLLVTLLVITIMLSSCELVGDILEFGVWVGLIIAAVVIGLILWLVRKFRR